MARVIEEEKADEVDLLAEQELPPYPAPKRISTVRPWRSLICAGLGLGCAIALFLAFSDVIVADSSEWRDARAVEFEARIDELKGKVESVQASQAKSERASSPRVAGDAVAVAQTALIAMGAQTEVAPEDVAKAVSGAIPYLSLGEGGGFYPWAWPASQSSQDKTRWTPLTGATWRFATPQDRDAESWRVAWVLENQNSKAPLALAEAAWDPKAGTFSDFSVIRVSGGFWSGPEAVAAPFSDGEWLRSVTGSDSAGALAIRDALTGKSGG